MTVQYPNFYENLQEAHIRLLRTVVTYDGIPYVVLAITSHNPDGIFRIYIHPINLDEEGIRNVIDVGPMSSTDPDLGPYIDREMLKKPNTPVIRKQMNSPYFNKFRPFTLGMCNYGTKTFYLERQPVRQREQGLTRSMIIATRLTLDTNVNTNGKELQIYSPAFHSCVIGDHPSAEECLYNLKDPEIDNEAAAFHRDFAIVRGPVGLLFLAYKEKIVGALTNGDFSELRLGKKFSHIKEAVSELNLFTNIIPTRT